MKDQLNSLLQREMTRKEFMATVAVGLASVAGLGTIIKFANPSFGTATTSPQQPKVSNAYGSSSYGG